MQQIEILSERLFEALINGDRTMARAVTEHAAANGVTPEEIVTDLFWPAYENIAKLYRADQLTRLAHHMATRLLRTMVDQAVGGFTFEARNGKSVAAFCGPTDADELAGQIATDLVERAGYEIAYCGGTVATDEILGFVQDRQPDCLLLFASAPSDLPEIRELIDRMREIGACAQTQIVVGGGVFNRAEGLAEEIGADLWATDPIELVHVMTENPEQRAGENQRTVGKTKPVIKKPASRSRKAA